MSRLGVARLEALIEALDRELNLTDSTLVDVKGCQFAAQARTATADGTGTGTIADGESFITVTSGGANTIMILPTPTPGTIVWLSETGSTGYELRSSAPASVGINGGTGVSAESAIAGGITLVRCVCVSATLWICTQFDADADESKVEAAA